MNSGKLAVALGNTIMTRYPDPDQIPYMVWCYVQGYVLKGLEKLFDATGDPRYLNYIRRFADQHVSADGNLHGFTGCSLDDMMAGSVIVAIYRKTGEEKYRRAAEIIRRAFDDYPRNRDGGFWHARSLPGEMWIDGVFMGQMFLAAYGAYIGDADYCFNETAHQIITFANHCLKGETGLYLHAYHEPRTVSWADPHNGLSPEVWSEGLGWYGLILVETLNLMPRDHPDRMKVVQILVDLVEGLRKTQDSDTGLWYQVVDKGDRPDNWHDTSGSAMFVYTIQGAINLGLVPPEIYLPVVKKGYAGMLSKAIYTPDGLVDIVDACDGVCVQNSYADYINYPKTVNAKEAVGGVLWAATSVEFRKG